MTIWHARDSSKVFSDLDSSEKGIGQVDASNRIQKYGANRLVKRAAKSPLQMFVEQFKNVLVIVLIIAAVISAFLGELTDAVAIAVIVVLNAFLGFHQEFKAEKAIEALKKMIVTKVVVVRDGRQEEIDADQLVPGDLVILEEGNRVPADMRLVEVMDLSVDEAALTGESVPSRKSPETLSENLPVGDRKNMAFMGTIVTYGRAKGIVVETGMKTEIGKIASLVQESEGQTPLQQKLDKFGVTIGKIAMVIAAVVFIAGMMTGLDTLLIFLTSISLAVAAVPEGLPAVVALTLSIGTQRMLRKNAVVRRLASVEALGSATVICSDKTGTMTTNEMTVRKVWVSGKTVDVSGVGFEPKGEFTVDGSVIDSKSVSGFTDMMRISKMCNDAVLKNENGWRVIGDPTEGALIVLADKADLEENYERIGEVPFSSFRKMMTTVHKSPSGNVSYTKGAPEMILKGCDLDEIQRNKVMEAVHGFASQGMRVLAMSYKELGASYDVKKVESGMTFLGLVAMIDPPRKETKEAISLCKQAGIRVVMMTGDHKLTAKAVANEVGIEGEALSGEEVDALDESGFSDAVKKTNIFARISPEHKLRIVKKLQEFGEIVAVSGDGVNDAPALKSAEIGVAMGIKGSDVSKEAANMVLLDDNFSSIVSAVGEGRGIYDNIKKFVKYLLSANIAEVLFVTVPMILMFPAELLPTLLPIHLLWMNLVTDGIPALALGIDPKEKDIMSRRPRRPKEGILENNWVFIIAGGLIGFVVAFVVFNMFIPHGVEKARTAAFSTLVIFELFLVFNCRSDTRGAFRKNPLENKWLVLSIVMSVGLQMFIVQLPIVDEFFGSVPLTIEEWLYVFGFASVGLLVMPELFVSRLGKLEKMIRIPGISRRG